MPREAWWMLLLGWACPALIVVAVVVKLREIRQARRWPATPGKVIASRVQSRRNKPGDPGYNSADTEMTNEPFVLYEYSVAGQTYRADRIDIGEKTSGYELEAVLDRYPVGAAVTVYFDPANPAKAVLERDFPAKVYWAIGGVLAVSIAAPVVAVLVYIGGVGWLKAHMANPRYAAFAAAAGGFGLVALLFSAALVAAVVRAGRWPTVRGRVIASGVERFRHRDPGSTVWRTMNRAGVVYTYEVNGRQYQGDRLTTGVVLSASVPLLARRVAAKYPVGREVDVHYNPQNPGESVLRPWSWFHLLPFVMTGGVLALAWAVGTGRM